jgi:hypothetical protein
VQPTQLSLMPDQMPAPPAALVEQLPAAQVEAAVGLLARLIAKAADPSAARTGQQVSGDE